MSISNIKLIATTELYQEGANFFYKTQFRLTTPISIGTGIYDSGGVLTPLTETFTESTFNLTVQQACADNANADTENVEAFVASDVYGGRI